MDPQFVKNTYREQVLHKTAPALLRYFLGRTTSHEEAADLVAETLASAWRAVARMPPEPEAARMWLFGVAKNTLRHHVRSSGRRRALVERLALTLDATASPPDDDVLDVRAAIDQLPSELAEIVRLIHWDGFTAEEAATLIGIPSSTARSRHARARERLRLLLAPSTVVASP